MGLSQYITIYVVLSFAQALFMARGINKITPIEHPKITVALFTLFGPGTTVVFLCGMLGCVIEKFVKGK